MLQKIKIGNSNTVHFILKDGNVESKFISYINERDRLDQIQSTIRYLTKKIGVFQVIFYHWESGNVILDKALWGI